MCQKLERDSPDEHAGGALTTTRLDMFHDNVHRCWIDFPLRPSVAPVRWLSCVMCLKIRET